MSKWYEASGPQHETVLSSCIRLSRNLCGIPFPAGLGESKKKEVLQKICDVISDENSSVYRKFHAVRLDSLELGTVIALAERGAVTADFIENRGGRGLLVSDDESKCIMVNGEDHFLFQVRQSGLSLQDAYSAADHLDTIFDKSLHFAFDKRLGYLTCNPALLGTGMVASLLLHLPALDDTGAAARIASNLQPLGISLRSVVNTDSGPCGAVYRLSNRMTLGLSEQEAITNLNGIAGQIIAQERAARNNLIQDISVQDTVGRSLGIFRSARLMSYAEFLNLASMIRFGIAAGFLKEINICQIDSLAMLVQPANLEQNAGRKLLPDEKRALRAKLVRKIFTERENGDTRDERKN
jgi:protein arginine kinase